MQKRREKPILVSGANSAHQAETNTNLSPPPVPLPQAGTVLPVGVYFGPGLMRSFVQVGILKALNQAQVPIVSVGGEEWGAIVAGLYSFSKSGNDVEWQMLKLRKDQVPDNGFLRREVDMKDSAALYQYLKSIFGEKNLSNTKIPFSCTTVQGFQMQLLRSGGAAEQIAKCASLPPFYKPFQNQWISGAVAPNGEWLDPMIKDGAKFIIYIDVLGDGPFFTKSHMTHSDEAVTIMTAVKNGSQWQFMRANMVLKVPVQNDLLDFDARRDLIKQGEKFGTGILPEIMKQIGMNQQ